MREFLQILTILLVVMKGQNATDLNKNERIHAGKFVFTFFNVLVIIHLKYKTLITKFVLISDAHYGQISNKTYTETR